ncbi:hypothetical protein F5146DRAFT_1038912, partial [Armillaria mellea]
MSCLTCSNCGSVNLLPPDPQVQTLKTIQGSDGLVSQLLRGSRPLLDADHAFIDAEITNLKRLRTWYDAKLQEIRLYRKQLKDRESIYAPIRRLPRDILIEIFHHVCDSWWEDYRDEDEDEDFIRDSLNVTRLLWILGRICGLWRDTLHASPASWGRYVSVRSALPKHAPAILQTYLKRTCEIMTLLIQSCHRWKNVRIHTIINHIHHLESISHLPILQTIDIDISDQPDSDYYSDVWLDAPRLWQATLSSHGIHQIRLPPTITHYSGYVTCAYDLQLLSRLPKLRTCRLEKVLRAFNNAPVVMAELCQLFVEYSHILDYITAPKLQSLTIAERSRESMSNLPVFFRRLGCHLESLSIHTKIMESKSSASIRDVFSSEACFTISHLKFGFLLGWDNVPHVLASSSILPNLQHLVPCFEDRYSRNKETEVPALFEMIRSRHKAGLLKMIEVQFFPRAPLYGDGDIKADIQALAGDNLEVRVEQWNPLYLDHQLAFWDPQRF